MSAADSTKRVFMSMGDSNELLKKPEKNTGTIVNKSKTFRLDLDLFEPDEHKFPEFNYKKLAYIEKKKQKKIAKLPNGNHDDPFAEDDDNVERIARELEAKYGNASSYGKTGRHTYIDRAAGYDASDTFIDDTEAYDELIPDEIETDRGGFYINSGSLEFKKLSNFERPGDEIRMPKAKKRALSTSSESSGSDDVNEEKNVEEKLKKKKNHTEKKVKVNTTSSSDEQGKAKKSKKEKREKVAEKVEKVEKPKEVQPVKEPEKKKTVEKEPEKILKTTTVKDMLRAKRDNLRKMEQGKPTSSGATTATDDEGGESESVSSLAVSESSRDSQPEMAPQNEVKEVHLPENLPAPIVQLINNLKQQAESASASKSAFFNNNTLNQLVTIDNGAKSVNATVRINVFNYLEQFVPCTKKTLFAKLRKHRIQQIETKVNNEINKMRKIVADAMPNEILKHEQEMRIYEERKTTHQIVGDNSFELHVPRKKFHWNDNSRLVLSLIVQYLQELHKSTKVKKESEQEFLLRRLRDEVVALWPEDWIKIEDFSKELEKKKKKESKLAQSKATAAILSKESSQQMQSQVQVQPKTITASPIATNGKLPVQTPPPKTENCVKNCESEMTSLMNGKSPTSQKTSPTASSATISVIKRSSDHSINSIISSPSPPTTIHPPKVQESMIKPRVIELEKLVSPTDLLKVTQNLKSTSMQFISPPIDASTSDKKVNAEKARRSDSSDSDCVEIVGEFNPIQPAKSVFNHNNNKDPKKTNQFNVKNPLTSPTINPQQRKSETSQD
ncbi:CLUMA_CG003124, isoform A [Clunio marinus]|uniref:CLUMA_CG003124, isoform A n=1 Tax=Clunio marinus TaxID=568069 RepID=A0A1J1HMT0_9DIPT|nr:CLUMA_CG003124, isoform A [Clunio marinus]